MKKVRFTHNFAHRLQGTVFIKKMSYFEKIKKKFGKIEKNDFSLNFNEFWFEIRGNLKMNEGKLNKLMN